MVMINQLANLPILILSNTNSRHKQIGYAGGGGKSGVVIPNVISRLEPANAGGVDQMAGAV